jgi:arginine exporter protein ArgO
MKASKFTDAQKAFILKQGADGHPVAEICRKAGISEATYFAARTFGSTGRISMRDCCLMRCGG